MTRERVAAMIVSLTDGNRVTGTMRRAFMIAILSLVAIRLSNRPHIDRKSAPHASAGAAQGRR
jgi:hypothetical protein